MALGAFEPSKRENCTLSEVRAIVRPWILRQIRAATVLNSCAVLVPRPRKRVPSRNRPTAYALAFHSSPPIHRHYLPSPRAGNDRLAGPSVDREVKRCEPTEFRPIRPICELTTFRRRIIAGWALC